RVNAGGGVGAVPCGWERWAHGVARHISGGELKAYLKEALPLVEPQTAAQFLTRAQRRLAVGSVNPAIADATAALKEEPKLVAALVVRGKAFLAKNDAPTAIEDFNEALKLDPNDYDVR